MFIEPSIRGERRGWIEVICGSMFSGKTEELIRRLRRAEIANLSLKIFKPAIDTRYDEAQIVSHNANIIPSIPVIDSKDILSECQNIDVVGIDEVQFFDNEIIHVCELLAVRGVRVIVAGLDMDYKGNPFGPMPQLLAIADFITKLHAICVRCGNLASMSYRKTSGDDQILLGEKEAYEPRCRHCYYENEDNNTIAIA
ncbi:thymidine kinase [Danxiaibacter flavus]|uniref:Thymidine kinase n=1 Tax=Danxiaibacter flavus TaxID=3049108 RepID=A0ABV3ZBP0_9BACT|nr:thymidine kinase [Chitinophagaceae bacterium DXS]